MMFRQRLFWILVAVLLLGTNLSAAQDTEFSLRGFAARDDFYVGAAVYTTHLTNPVHAELLAREFNMLTPEQEGKHCELEPGVGRFNFQPLDRLVAFAEEHDMAIHGHTLVWHQCMPRWVLPDAYTREQGISLLRDSIKTIVGRYKGRIPIWDVVNEGIADSGAGLRETPWQQLIGDDYIELAFRFAHEADPDALLFYNDYGAEEMNAKSDAIYEMVSDFIERGVPIHGVGLQAHFTMGTVNYDSMAENIQRLGELGLQVQITELDVRYAGEANDTILQQQAAEYYRTAEVCLESPYCTALITWGVSDRYTWLRGANLGFYENPTVQPLLFDDDYKPKPAYFAVLDLLARRAGATSILTDEQVQAMLEGPTMSLDIPEPVKSDPDQLAPDSVPGAVYYAAFPLTITLDGEIDDWDNVPRVTIDDGPMLPADHDTAMTFAVAADDTHLYFLADVKDSNIVYGNHEPASGWYLEDSVEFYINATGDLDLTAYQPGVAQIGIMAANLTNPDEPIIGGGNSASSGVQVVAVETDDGYRLEASVPLVNDAWEITPEHLGMLGFQAHLNGSSGNDRDTKLIWSSFDTQDQSWTNPSVFGRLVFWDINE